MTKHRADRADYHETVSPFFTGLVIASAAVIALAGLVAFMLA